MGASHQGEGSTPQTGDSALQRARVPLEYGEILHSSRYPASQPTPCKAFIPSCQSVQNVRGISQFSFFLDSQDGRANFVQTNPSLSFPIHFFQKYVKSFWCNLAVRWLLVVSRKTKAALAGAGEVESENWR